MSKNNTTSSDRARQCLSFDERPETPPEIRKFRRSKNLEPGRRFIHPGLADDMERLDLPNKVFGNKSDPIRYTAANLINATPQNVVERLNTVKAENTYYTLKREPLGGSYRRDYELPDKFTQQGEPFGRSSRLSAEPAKTIIFPEMSEASFAGEDLYKRSHGSYGVGEQKRRGYSWKINPDEIRFGVKGDTIAYNGVSRNIAEVLCPSAEDTESVIGTSKVEEHRMMGDLLGKTRDLGQGSKARTEQFVYGLPSAYTKKSKSQWSAIDTIKGRYRAEDLVVDPDLGKSITPGFRNITLESRAYGCPSLRSDIPVPVHRSVADPQNYGDEASASELINPRALAGSTIDMAELEVPRSRSSIQALFKSIGYVLEDEIFEMLFRQAAGDAQGVSINAFRNVLNAFEESR